MSHTLCTAFQKTAVKLGDAVAVQTHDGVLRLTWRDYAVRVRKLAAGFAALGVRHGDTVAMLVGNRPEMYVCDMALLHLGATPVSIYTTLAVEQLHEVLANAGSEVVIVDGDLYERVARLRAVLKLRHIIVLDGVQEGALGLTEVEQRDDGKLDFERTSRTVGVDDLATIIYTSGTTGAPKGVEITHAQIIAQVEGLAERLELSPADRTISFLPSAHIADRAACLYAGVVCGVSVTTVRDRKDLGAALLGVRPTYFAAVPRVWEKLKAGIELRIPAMPAPLQEVTQRALAVGYEKVRAEQAHYRGQGPGPSAAMLAAYAEADATTFAMIRGMLGLEQTRLPITAAAPIDVSVLEFFAAIGLQLCDVWGMSELAGAGTVNPAAKLKFGTVGTAMPGAELRLAEDGELLIRAPFVMKGYRRQPQETREIIDDDGWVHTGDVVSIDGEGYVTIVDRKKELIINAGGKNMSPANIENAIKAGSLLIGNVVCVGDKRPYNVALVVLDAEAALAWAKGHGVSDVTPVALAANPRVRAQIDVAVEKGNGRLSRVEQVKRYSILPVFWQPGGDELTPTSKLKRKTVNAKYASAIEELFGSNS